MRFGKQLANHNGALSFVETEFHGVKGSQLRHPGSLAKNLCCKSFR